MGKRLMSKFNPRIAKAIGITLGKKVAVRGGVATAGAAASATVVGAPIGVILGGISLALIGLDIYGIVRRMIDGKDLGSAICDYYLGFDPWDDNTTEATIAQNKDIVDTVTEIDIEEAKQKNNKSQSNIPKTPTNLTTGTSHIKNPSDSYVPGMDTASVDFKGQSFSSSTTSVSARPGLGSDIDSSTMARKAASMADNNTSTVYKASNGGYTVDNDLVKEKRGMTAEDGHKDKKMSIGRCATYVNKAIVDAGYQNYGKGDGWQVGSSLAKIGWQQVAFDPNKPNSFKPQKGDVVSFGRSSSTDPAYGHAAIFNGTNWVSDFVQSQMSPYTANKTRLANSYKVATVWRDPANATGSGTELGSGDISAYDRAKYTTRANSLSNSVASRTSTSGNTRSVINIDTSSVSNILRESYKVHVESRNLLEQIRDAIQTMSSNTSTTLAQQQPANNVMPESAIRLQHNSYA